MIHVELRLKSGFVFHFQGLLVILRYYVSIQMPFFFRLSVTSTESCPPCLKTSEIHIAVAMAYVPRSATSLFDLEPVKRQQHGCRVGYQARAAYTHTCEINSFVDTVRPNSQNKVFFLTLMFFSLHLTLLIQNFTND